MASVVSLGARAERAAAMLAPDVRTEAITRFPNGTASMGVPECARLDRPAPTAAVDWVRVRVWDQASPTDDRRSSAGRTGGVRCKTRKSPSPTSSMRASKASPSTTRRPSRSGATSGSASDQGGGAGGAWRSAARSPG